MNRFRAPRLYVFGRLWADMVVLLSSDDDVESSDCRRKLGVLLLVLWR